MISPSHGLLQTTTSSIVQASYFYNLFEIISSANRVLAYGLALTRLFRYYNISLDRETDMYEPTEHEIYSDRVLHLMEYHLEDGRWISNDTNEVEVSDVEEDEDEDEQANIPPQQAPPTPSRQSRNQGFTQVMEAINNLSLQMASNH